MSTRKRHQCHSCQNLMKGHRRGPDGTYICPTGFPLPSTSRPAPMPIQRQGTAFQKVTSPIRRGMTIELDEKGDQVLVDGHRYSRIMPGTLDSQVWIWSNGGGANRQPSPIVIDDDDNYIELSDDDYDDEVEYEGEIPRLSTQPPSLLRRMFSTPSRTPAPFTQRRPTARALGKRRQTDWEREMSVVSAAGEEWPLASLYQIPSDRVKQVVREARNQGLYTRVIPRSRVVPVPVGNNPQWIKEEEYEEEDSGFFEGFGERSLNGNAGGGRAGKEREKDWEVILGTDEGAVEHLRRIVLDNQEETRQKESRRAISHHSHHTPLVASNPSPPSIMPTPVAVAPPPQADTNWSNMFMAMVVGAIAMYYVLLKIPDD